MLAAKAGATYVSPFVGRLDDICEDGVGLVADIVWMYRLYKYETHPLTDAGLKKFLDDYKAING